MFTSNTHLCHFIHHLNSLRKFRGRWTGSVSSKWHKSLFKSSHLKWFISKSDTGLGNVTFRLGVLTGSVRRCNMHISRTDTYICFSYFKKKGSQVYHTSDASIVYHKVLERTVALPDSAFCVTKWKIWARVRLTLQTCFGTQTSPTTIFVEPLFISLESRNRFS